MAKKYKKIKRALARPKKKIKASSSHGTSFQQSTLQQGIAHHQAGRLFNAESLYRKVLLKEPNHPEALYFLGMLAHQSGKNEIAVELIRKALKYRPKHVDALIHLGVILNDQGKLDEAIACYRRVLTLKPNFAEVHNNLGYVFNDQGKLDEAIACYRKALNLKPDFAEAHSNLGNTLKGQGKFDEAIDSYRRALSLKPDYVEAHSNLLMCLNYLPDLSVSHYLDEARLYGRKATGKVSMSFSDWTFSSNPERLRVGLVSGDFWNHPVGYFLENMLENIDPGQIELIAYPTHYRRDDLTVRIHNRFFAWKPLVGMNDESAAQMIRDDNVHILLDLSGHTAKNRLPIFAWKPAPVQATWLGYFASTGMAEMDYLIADPVSIPESYQGHFTERVWYLPETRICFSPPVISEKLPPTPLPALNNRYITFGCFQNLAKINDEVLKTWSEIFKLMPQARLYLQNRQLNFLEMQEKVLRRLARFGITSGRIRLEKSTPRLDYLTAHNHVDIILDTFPFTGGTTTCEALWMGVPTVTFAGNIMIARQSASLLNCAGLSDWVATDNEDYVMKTLTHATDLENLARLRAGLRQQVLASPLFDGPRFARNFEVAMWGMWNRFRNEK